MLIGHHQLLQQFNINIKKMKNTSQPLHIEQGTVLYDIHNHNIRKLVYHSPMPASHEGLVTTYHILIDAALFEPIRMHETEIKILIDAGMTTREKATEALASYLQRKLDRLKVDLPSAKHSSLIQQKIGRVYRDSDNTESGTIGLGEQST